jgi:hypothetical protein
VKPAAPTATQASVKEPWEERLAAEAEMAKESVAGIGGHPRITGCTAYGSAALADILARAKTVAEGDRDNTGNQQGFAAGQLCAGGEIGDCRADLIAALTAARPDGKPGLPEREARRAVESGWAAGLKKPRTAPGRDSEPTPKQEAAVPACPETICLATVEPRPAKWIWFGRLADGEMTVLTGAPGIGKGLLLCYVVAHYTTGRPMFGDSEGQPAGHVLWIAVEDSLDSGLVPRLNAAGADLSRVHAWNMDRPVSLPEDTERIIAEVDRSKCRIVIIDPAPTLLDREHSSNNDADVRRSFSGLTAACRARRCTLVLVRHTNKRQLGDAMSRGGGSIGWTGMARVELMLGRRPAAEGEKQDQSVVTLATVKSNLGKWACSLDLLIVEAGAAAVLDVVGVAHDTTADDLCAQDKPRIHRKTADAEAMLRRLLADGNWHRQREIDAESAKADYSTATLRRAKAVLGVQSQQREGEWWWRMPPDAQGGVNEHLRSPSTPGGRVAKPVEHLPSSKNNKLEKSDAHGQTHPPLSISGAHASRGVRAKTATPHRRGRQSRPKISGVLPSIGARMPDGRRCKF